MEEDASQFSQLTYSQISPVDSEEKEFWELLQKVQQKRAKREFLSTRFSQKLKGQAWKIEQLKGLVKDQENFLVSAQEDFTKLQKLKKDCEINMEYLREDIAVSKVEVEEKTNRLLRWQTDLRQTRERSIYAITEARDFKNQITDKLKPLMTKRIEMQNEFYKIKEFMNSKILQLKNNDNDGNDELRMEVKENLLEGVDKKERKGNHECIMQTKLFQKLPQKRHPFLDALAIAGCKFERVKEKTELGDEHFQIPMEVSDVENVEPTTMEVLNAESSVNSGDLSTNDNFEIAMVCDRVLNKNTALTDDFSSEHTSKTSLNIPDGEIINQEKLVKCSYSAGLQSTKAVSEAPDMHMDKPFTGASFQDGAKQTSVPSCELEEGLSINYNMENYLQEMVLRNKTTFETRNKDENSHIDKVCLELREESAEGEREFLSSALPKKESTVSGSTDISMESFTFEPKDKNEIQKSDRQRKQKDIYGKHRQIMKNDMIMRDNFSLKNENDFQGIAKHMSENSLAHSFADPIHSTRQFLNSFKLSKHDEYIKLCQQPEVSDFPNMYVSSPSSKASNDEDIKSATVPNSKLPPEILSSPECEENDANCSKFKFPDSGESLLEMKQQLEKWKTSMSEPLGPAPVSLAVIPHFNSEYHQPQYRINRGSDGDMINVHKNMASNSTIQHVNDVKCITDLLKSDMSSESHSPIKLDEGEKYKIRALPYQPALRTTSDPCECENLGSPPKESFKQQKSHMNEKPTHFSWDILKQRNKEINQKMPSVDHLMAEDETTDTEIMQSLNDLELTLKDERNSILQNSTLTLSSALKSLKHGYFHKEPGTNNFFSGISKTNEVFSTTKESANSSKPTSLGLFSKASSSNRQSNYFGAQSVRENRTKDLKSEELRAGLPFSAARNFGEKAIEMKMLERKQETFFTPQLVQQSSSDLIIPPTEFCQSEMPYCGKSGNNKEKQDKQNHYEINHISATEAEDDIDIEKPYNLSDEPIEIHNGTSKNSLPMDIDSSVLQAPCNTPKDDSESNETIEIKSARKKELQKNAYSINQEMYNPPSNFLNNSGLNTRVKYSEAVPISVPVLSLLSDNSEMTDSSKEDKSMSVQQLLANHRNPSVNYKETAPAAQNIHQQEKSQNLDSMETDTIVLSSDAEDVPSTCSQEFIKQISKFSIDSPYPNFNNLQTTRRTLRDISDCNRLNESYNIEQEAPPHQFAYQKMSSLHDRNVEFDNNPIDNHKKTASLCKNVPQLSFITKETSGVARKGKENKSPPPLPEMKQGSAKRVTDFSAYNYPPFDTEKETGKLKHKIKTISEIMNETQNQQPCEPREKKFETSTKDAGYSYGQLEGGKLVPQEKVSELNPFESSYDSKRNLPFNMNQTYWSNDFKMKASDKYFRNLMNAYDLQVGPLSMTSDVSTFDPNCSTQNTAMEVISPLATAPKKSETHVPFDFEKYMKPLSPESASPFQMTSRSMFSGKNTATKPSSRMTETVQTPGLQSIADIVKSRCATRKE